MNRQNQCTEIVGERFWQGPIHNRMLYRVLLAEDDPEMRKMLAWALSKKGYQVISCHDGNELMKKLGFLGPEDKDGNFDLIISDIKMPGATGYDVFKASRSVELAEGQNPTQVILITAFGYDPHHSVVQANREGLAAVLLKPFKVQQLLNECRAALTCDD